MYSPPTVNLDPSTRKAAPVRALDPKMLPGARAELYAERQQVADERKRARQAAAAAGSVTGLWCRIPMQPGLCMLCCVALSSIRCQAILARS